jgi:hypothetical protein
MLPEIRQALKEWAVVDEALASGEVTLLLRRGGIHERRGDFAVEHREFWIYPTAWHQNPEDLAAHLHPLLDRLPARPAGEIRLRTCAVVEEVFRIEDPDALDRLEGLHPLSTPAAHRRFGYRGKPGVQALLVRAWVQGGAHLLPETERYAGCVSWVELDRALPTAGLSPVLSDEAFARRAAEVRARLAGGA